RVQLTRAKSGARRAGISQGKNELTGCSCGHCVRLAGVLFAPIIWIAGLLIRWLAGSFTCTICGSAGFCRQNGLPKLMSNQKPSFPLAPAWMHFGASLIGLMDALMGEYSPSIGRLHLRRMTRPS